MEFGEAYFQEIGNSSLAGKVPAFPKFVQNVRNVAKQDERKRVAVLRLKYFRKRNFNVVHPSDFAHFMKVLQNVLRCIERTFNECLARLSVSNPSQPKLAQRFFGEQPARLDKWCINFLDAIVLGSAGNKPEVFWMLQAPTRVQLNGMVEEARADNYF